VAESNGATAAHRSDLADMAGSGFAIGDDAIGAILSLVADHLGMRTAYLMRLLPEPGRTWIANVYNGPGGCDLPAGGEVAVADTFCSATLGTAGAAPLLIADISTDPVFRFHAAAAAFPAIGSYVGVPIRHADGTLLGTLCAVDPAPRPPLTPEQVDTLIVLARLLATSLAREDELAARRRAVGALQRGEDRFRALVQLTSDVVVIVDAAGLAHYVSPAIEQVLGHRDADLLGTALFDLIHPDDVAAIRGAFAATLASGPGIKPPIEFRLRRRDAGWAWIEAVGTNLLHNPAVGGVMFHCRDVTARRQAEAAGREREERLRTIVETVAEGIVFQQTDGRITACNASAERILGLTTDEMMGRTSLDPRWSTVRPDGSPLPAAEHPSMVALRTGVPASDELMGINTATGERRWISVNARPLFDGGATPVAVVSSFSDVTERETAAATLAAQVHRAERARHETNAILDAAGEGMLLIAPDRRIVATNRRFEELFAIAAGELLGRPFDAFAAHTERVFASADEVQQLVAGTLRDTEHRLMGTVRQRWPEPRELELASTPVVGADSEHLGRLYTFRDVTHEREVDRMKSEFVSMVSHEMRTPLTSITGYVDLLLDGEAGALDEIQNEFLGVVKHNAGRLVSLIEGLLDVSRIDAGKLSLEFAPVDLGAAVRQTATMLRPQLDGKRQRLTVDVPDDLTPVNADADRLAQIVTNLLSNAHKYTPAGGEIAIAAHVENDLVRVTVRDTGVGLSEEDLTRLFTRFFRARNPHATAGGTGLGLVITRSLVELHGGTMTVESAPGVGSTFGFTLPVAR